MTWAYGFHHEEEWPTHPIGKVRDRATAWLELLAGFEGWGLMPRNMQVTEAVLKGALYKDVGAQHGIGKERVRGIVCQMLVRARYEKIIRPGLIVASIDGGPPRIYDVLEISERSRNCLANEYITTHEALQEKTDRELLRMVNFGSKSLNDVRRAQKIYEEKLNDLR